MDRRTLVKLFVGGAGASVLAACGVAPQAPSAPPTTAPAPAAAGAATAVPTAAAAKPAATVVAAPTAPPAAAQPKRGGSLRQGNALEIVTLDPMLKVGNDAVWLGVYDRLSAFDDNLKPQPMLAESWESNADSTQYKFNLRKGVQFHSGREMTSDDVKYSLERAANPKVAAGQYAGMAAWYSAVETPDKYTAIFKSDIPRPTIFDLLEFMNICDKDTLEGPDAKTTAVGTGPFKFVEWIPGDHVTLARNPNYWISGRPYLDEIRIPIFRDQQAMATSLEAGAIDVALRPNLVDFNRLKTDSRYLASSDPISGAHFEAGVNLTQPPFDNKQVRQALSYAVDRKRFVDTILGGVGQAESLPWSPSQLAYDAARQNYFAFDLDKARSLLADAGVTGLEFDYLPNPINDQTTGFGQIYQSDLAKIGVKLNIKNLDGATWLDQVNNRKYNGIYFATGTYFNLSPSTALTNGKAFNPSNNNSGYTSEKYAALITAGASETDPAKLKEIYNQLNDILLEDAFVWMVTIAPPTLLARTNVQGVQWTAHESPWYVDTWIA
jgi:peptide/nickel transport system substrate-binding protein